MSNVTLDFKKILNRLILFIGFGVVAHIIFVLNTTEKDMLLHLKQLSIPHIVMIGILMILPWMGYAARILMWSGFLNEKITYKEAVRVVVTADVASALSPTAVGGAPIKAALLINRGFSNASVGFMLTYGVIEDIVFYITGIVLAGVFSTGLLSKIGVSMGNFFQHNAVLICTVIVILAIYLVIQKRGKMPAKMQLATYIPARFKDSFTSYKHKFLQSIEGMKTNFLLVFRQGKWRMLLSITVLFLQWMSKFTVLIVILHAFGVDFDWIQIYIRQWVVYVTMLFIPTPGATGGAEASFLLIFGKSMPADLSFLIVSVWRLFTYYFILLTAVFLYTILSYFVKKEEITIVKPE